MKNPGYEDGAGNFVGQKLAGKGGFAGAIGSGNDDDFALGAGHYKSSE
jgi:hypothetical protein